MNDGVAAVGVLAGSYIAGGIPFSHLAARAAGADLRTTGTGTVSGTGVSHVAGVTAMLAAGISELAAAAAVTALAARAADRREWSPPARHWLAAAAGGAAVAGHNWSPFLRGAGGRGIAPAIGTLFVQAPLGGAVIIAGLGFGRLGRETGLGSAAAYAALAPILATRYGRRGAVTAGFVLAPMVAKRLAGNAPLPAGAGRRAYLARLLFDRDSWVK